MVGCQKYRRGRGVRQSGRQCWTPRRSRASTTAFEPPLWSVEAVGRQQAAGPGPAMAWRNRPGPESILATLLTSLIGKDCCNALSGWLGMSCCRRSRRKWTVPLWSPKRVVFTEVGQNDMALLLLMLLADGSPNVLNTLAKKGACSAQKQTEATMGRQA